jgi:nicotinamidase-related amidase
MSVNILIVVDVQNCFIAGGSINGADAEINIDSNKLGLSQNQILDIEALMDKSDHIYFTRDYHPLNHLSLEGENLERPVNYDTTYPNHCRNQNNNCANTKTNKQSATKQTIGSLKLKYNTLSRIPSEYDNKRIIGTDLSYLLYLTKYHKLFDTLISTSFYTIGLNPNIKLAYKQIPNIKKIIIPNPLSMTIIGKPQKFNQITKGEYCSYEAYSAFNYHYKLDSTGKKTYLPPFQSNFSTGLFESILKQYTNTNTNSKIINITICGLVGTICVLHSIIQGILIWNFYKKKYRNITINFIYSLKGTLFLDYENINTLIGEFQKNRQSDQTILLTLAKTLIANSIEKHYSNVKSIIKFTLLDFNGVIVGIYENGAFTDSIQNYRQNYRQKYLKYKKKYLQLKNAYL